MTPWAARWRFPLYLRIWIAVVATVGLLTLAFGYLWRLNTEQTPMREVIIRNEADDVIGRSMVRPNRVPGQGVEFEVAMNDGRKLTVQLPPRPATDIRPWLPRGAGTLWLLALVGLAVAVGSFPIVRRLTKRLESLRKGVERWGEGDLSARVDETGTDEVAFLAQRFNHAAERVETLVKTHKSLLANASHELRSPLARIRMGLELMGDGRGAAHDEIARNIAELDQLIDEILLASRLDARESDVGTFEPVDLTGLAAEECARTGAELSEGTAVQPVVVQGVAKLLRRAIRNLLENARRYGGSGPVEVHVDCDGRFAQVRVCDRGPGVPRELRDRIFEPFYRLPGASEREGGVGLGLALVRSIAVRHHGSVACDDNPGGGACFALRLPCHEM